MSINMTKHCAFVRHEGSNKAYLFEVPSYRILTEGTKVICLTRRGEKRAVLIGDSFWVSETGIESITKAMGATSPLKNIVAVVEEVVTEKITRLTIPKSNSYEDLLF